MEVLDSLGLRLDLALVEVVEDLCLLLLSWVLLDQLLNARHDLVGVRIFLVVVGYEVDALGHYCLVLLPKLFSRLIEGFGLGLVLLVLGLVGLCRIFLDVLVIDLLVLANDFVENVVDFSDCLLIGLAQEPDVVLTISVRESKLEVGAEQLTLVCKAVLNEQLMDQLLLHGMNYKRVELLETISMAQQPRFEVVDQVVGDPVLVADRERVLGAQTVLVEVLDLNLLEELFKDVVGTVQRTVVIFFHEEIWLALHILVDFTRCFWFNAAAVLGKVNLH